MPFAEMIQTAQQVIPLVSVISLLGAAVTFLWGVVIFLLNRIRDSNEAEFKRFHEIIRKIQAEKNDNGDDVSPYIEVQIAAIYELRYLKRYHAMSVIYLKAKKVEWGAKLGTYTTIGVPVIEDTIQYIESRPGGPNY